MKIEELIPKPTQKVQFKLLSYKSLPKENGCYVLTSFNDDILYIGLAMNLYDRFKQHLENTEKTYPTLDGKAVWFYFITFDPKNLPKLERTWLNQFASIEGRLPILNKVNSPMS